VTATTAPAAVAGFCLDQLVRRNLRGVWVRGDLPAGPAVWAANHHSWWDFFVARAALRSIGRTDVGVLMDPANIASRRVFGWAGAVGSDRLRAALEVPRSGGVLVVFPEGELRAPGPLGAVRPGAAWFARRTGAPMLAVVTRVVMRGHQAPEAYLDISPVPAAAELPDVLADRLTAVDADLTTADPSHPMPGYRQVVRGVRSWSERMSR
jgi:1-acyl-sn-glycerol-3-phosphate acyltransferase